MKKRAILALGLSLTLLLSACGKGETQNQPQARLTVVATTYPVYLLASAVAENVDGVVVERLNTGAVSCLHDYTLTVSDMKLIESADIIAMNGVGLEDFMDDALSAAKGTVIDCSQGVQLLEAVGHDHHDGDESDGEHYDPHIWMDPENAVMMAQNMEKGLAQADPEYAQAYSDNLMDAVAQLSSLDSTLQNMLQEAQQVNGVDISGLITFHDGFQYFAQAFGLPLLAAIEEEEGSEASAQVINETVALVKEHNIPMIFAEVNGSDATAQAIARETGCQVGQLTMLMDGPDDGKLSNYLDGLSDNVAAIVNGFAGEEVIG